MNSDDHGKSPPASELELVELGRRLSAVIDVLGQRQKAAKIAERSTDQLAKYARGAVEPPFLPLARLCAAAGVRMDWLAWEKGPMLEPLPGVGSAQRPAKGAKVAETAPQSGSQPVRYDVLTVSIQLAEEALDGRVLPTEKRAELVGLIYEMLEEGLPNAKVLRFARTAIK